MSLRSILVSAVLITAALWTCPAPAGAQQAVGITTLESALTSPDRTVRAAAVSQLTPRAREITPAGLTRLIDLLRDELDGTASPVATNHNGDEAFGQYMMMLTQLVGRFDDPRATPLLARAGIGMTNSSTYQVAASGDTGLPPLVHTWDTNEALRPAVILAMAQMRFHADSAGATLSSASRATIADHLLQASAAREGWIRQAFVDATEILRDPVYLPLVQSIVDHDPGRIDGRRYIAINAAKVLPMLMQRRAASTPGQLLRSVREEGASACNIGWIKNQGICNSVDSKLATAMMALARGQSDVARSALGALQGELSAQRGKFVSERAYSLLFSNVEYLTARI